MAPAPATIAVIINRTVMTRFIVLLRGAPPPRLPRLAFGSARCLAPTFRSVNSTCRRVHAYHASPSARRVASLRLSAQSTQRAGASTPATPRLRLGALLRSDFPLSQLNVPARPRLPRLAFGSARCFAPTFRSVNSMCRRVSRLLALPQAFPPFFEERVDGRHQHQRDEQRRRQSADDDARERDLQLAAFADAERHRHEAQRRGNRRH